MRYLLGIMCSLASAFVCAESHQGSDMSEAILTAIKEQFVAQAQDADTQVTNTAWLDSDGPLHESTMIRSDVRVRGVGAVTGVVVGVVRGCWRCRCRCWR